MRRRNPAPHLAGRFAAKEAGMKAIGTGHAFGVLWRDLEVIRRETALYIHRSRCLSEQVFGRFVDLFSLPPKRAALRSR